MTTMTTTTEVVFRRPFKLRGLDGLQPPGTYRIESYVELLDRPATTAYRRLETSIELHAQPPGITRIATIDPSDLDEALRVDGIERSQEDVAVDRPVRPIVTAHPNQNRKVFSMSSWFIPPIVIPALLLVLVVVYGLLRTAG